jgi:prevent-host-death family protein
MKNDMKHLTVIASSKFRNELSNIIKRIVLESEHFLVEKNNLPVMVCLSVEEYKKLTTEKELGE